MEGEEDSESVYKAWQLRHRPRNEIPSSVRIDAAIGASDGLAVFIASLSVYSNGLSFTTEATARGGPGSIDLPVPLIDGMRGASEPRHQMLLGTEFADGRKCVSTARGHDVDSTATPLLISDGASGSNSSALVSWFLSPLPPPGDLHLYCAWPSAGIAERVTLIPADALTSAANRVQQLWPSPQMSDQQPDPSPLQLPDDSWFSTYRPADGSGWDG